MKKSWLYRWFGLGAIPRKLRPTLAAEGVVIADEGMAGWFVTGNVRAPGKRYWRRREFFTGCLVVTSQRILGYTYYRRQINLATDDPKISRLSATVPEPEILRISFESSDFRDNWRGVLVYIYKTDKARAFYEALMAVGVQPGQAGE